MPKIVQTQQITTKIINSFDIQNIEVILFTSAVIAVKLNDINGSFVELKFITLAGKDYTNWGKDDNYIINFIASKLGFILCH
jgi:hypothetical protein